MFRYYKNVTPGWYLYKIWARDRMLQFLEFFISIFVQLNHDMGGVKKPGLLMTDNVTENYANLSNNMINNLPVAFYTCDEKGYLTYFNKAAAILWGREPEIGKDLWCGSWKIYHTDGTPMPLDLCPMALTLMKGNFYEGEEIIIERPDQTFRNLLVYPRPILNEDQDVIGAQNTLVDITAQKTSEIKQAMLSAIVESSDDAIISKTLEGIITSWNRGAEKIFGYTEKEMVGKPINLLIPEHLQDEETTILRELRSGNKIDHFSTVRLSKSGKKVFVSLTVSPIRDSYGRVIGASKIARDVTDQLLKEKSIKKNAANLEILYRLGKSISEKLDVPIIMQRIIDATTAVSGASYGLFLYKSTRETGGEKLLSAMNSIPQAIYDDLDFTFSPTALSSIFNDNRTIRINNIEASDLYERIAGDFNFPTNDLKTDSLMVIPIVSSSENVTGTIFLGHPDKDAFTPEIENLVFSITAQGSIALDNGALFEEVKSLNEKKDEFIALASHELKTPLTTIKGCLQIMQRSTSKENSVFLKKGLRQIDKLDTLITELLDISKIEAGKIQFKIEVVDIQKQILDIIETFAYSHESHTIKCVAADGDYNIPADASRIEQVFVNILSNAIKYSPNSSRVYVNLSASASEVEIVIRDEGLGLSQDDIHKIFLRFYRAKGTGSISGLGVGLYLSKEIIERHHGSIVVTSELGQGSAFTIRLPKKLSHHRESNNS